ncbi:Membrane protein involved in the export of O-antigen and teichoic acid [Fodinibius salinus]|uniref:Membrane protein involved in the export of O-antigen and teichoic acid n=1 Tax=Fodinibius salinus TaxID=860790 RepID=A0A5D3YNW4_9BACT|nr:flippase [Fodinibius salinus]TYP95630.1 Membrane protein involved in the export of O-antigen and teichoic acid [Fodinibius salinus]
MFNIIFYKKKIQQWLSDDNFAFIFKGSIYSSLSKVAVVLSSVVINYLIAQFYGAEAVGRYAIIQSFLAISCIFSEGGLRTSLVRLIPEYAAKFSKAVSFKIYKKSHLLLLLFSITVSLCLFLFLEPLKSLLFNTPGEEITIVLYLAIGVILFRSLRNINIETFRALGEIKRYSFFKAIPNFLELVLFLFISFIFTANINIPIYAHLLSLFIMGILFFLLGYYSFPEDSSNDDQHDISYKSIFNVSVPLFLVTTMNVVIAQTDILMLGFFMDEADVGIYHIVYKIGILTIFVLSAISSIAAPKFSQLYHDDKIEELEKSATQTTKLIFFTTLPIVIVLILFGEFILSFFGSEFVVGYQPLLILLVGQFINSVTGPVGYLLSMSEYQNMVRNTTIIAGFSNILFNALLIPLWGIIGAAIATGSSLAMKNLINYYQVKKNLGIDMWGMGK